MNVCVFVHRQAGLTVSALNEMFEVIKTQESSRGHSPFITLTKHFMSVIRHKQ